MDVFIYPAAHFDGSFSPGDFPQLADAVLLLDTDGRGQTLIDRVRDWQAAEPAPPPAELRSQVAWCRKMLLRTRRGDAEGLFRWHWVLVDSLELCCDLLGWRYQGPKKSLRWLETACPEGYARYTAALAGLDGEALTAWVEYLEALLSRLDGS